MMIPAIFSRLTSKDSEELVDSDVFITAILPADQLTMVVAIDPNTEKFIEAPLALFRPKMQQSSGIEIARPTDVA